MSKAERDNSLEVALGAAVRELREAKGVSQEHFAHLAGIDRAHMSRIERGLVSPSLRTMGVVARTLGTTVSELLGRAEAGRTQPRS